MVMDAMGEAPSLMSAPFFAFTGAHGDAVNPLLICQRTTRGNSFTCTVGISVQSIASASLPSPLSFTLCSSATLTMPSQDSPEIQLESRQNRPRQVEPPDRKEKGVQVKDGDQDKRNLFWVMAGSVLGWLTPYEQLEVLRRKKDFKAWERFRDSLMNRWSNLNVIGKIKIALFRCADTTLTIARTCRAVSTIEFAGLPFTRLSFTLGVISLLSSLIAIGFGVGLIYVLGDVGGSALSRVDARHPRLYLFAISIPEIWAFISFGTFFTDVGVICWQATDKGWIVKAGIVGAAVALILHLVAFGFLFREQDTTEFLIPENDLFPSDEANRRKGSQDQRDPSRSMPGGQRLGGRSSNERKSDKEGGWANDPHHVLSSSTLVESPGPSSSFVTGRTLSDESGSAHGKSKHAGSGVPMAIPEEGEGGVMAKPGEAIAHPHGSS